MRRPANQTVIRSEEWPKTDAREQIDINLVQTTTYTLEYFESYSLKRTFTFSSLEDAEKAMDLLKCVE